MVVVVEREREKERISQAGTEASFMSERKNASASSSRCQFYSSRAGWILSVLPWTPTRQHLPRHSEL